MEVATLVSSNRFRFYVDMKDEETLRGVGAGEQRRMFGGRVALPGEWSAACALHDRSWRARCSGSVVAPHWVLTAAHCVTPRIAYVTYNTRRPIARDGDFSKVDYLYRHPSFEVVQEDKGQGMDVTLLHHDVGMIRTRKSMKLAREPPLPPVLGMRLYSPTDLTDKEVQVLGYGRTERAREGERLVVARLVMKSCARGDWVHCTCGVAGRAEAAGGVCAGDSGGPVVYRGALVAVTSMGPVQCTAGDGITSVFTSLYEYAPLVNATIYDTEDALRMLRISASNPQASNFAYLLTVLALATNTFIA